MKNKEVWTDHTGREFDTLQKMCDYWKVTPDLFCKRRARGKSTKECLTGKGDPIYVRDGIEYYKNSEISKAFDIHPNTLRSKLAKGYTYDEIIDRVTYRMTGPNGKRYKDFEEMCLDYGKIPITVRIRTSKGMTLKDALEEPLSAKGRRAANDK